MPEKVKRLRVFSGPNGSGKSTVAFYILEHYNTGIFLNADELHKMLVQNGTIDLSLFKLDIADSLFTDYIHKEGKSCIKKTRKAESEGLLTCKSNCLTVPEVPGPYDAAIAADFLRYTVMQRGETFTFETVLSDPRKVFFYKRLSRRVIKFTCILFVPLILK